MSYVTLEEQVALAMLPFDTNNEVSPSTRLTTSCHLLELPDEVKLEIVKHIERRRDLYNFSLACRSLEDMTLSRLYKTINVEVPHTENTNWKQCPFPTFRPYVLRNMKELAIRNGIMNKKDPIYHRRTRSDASSMEDYVSEIMNGVPQHQLSTFSFLHQTPMSRTMLDDLSKHHGRSLQHLRCYELDLINTSDIALPSRLRSLECRAVHSGEVVSQLILANKNTLTSLSLGQDKHLIDQYRKSRISFLGQIPQPVDLFCPAFELNAMRNLKSLSLSGINLTTIMPSNTEAAFFFTQLESLNLESCPNTTEFLGMLAETLANVQSQNRVSPTHSVQLKKFSFRHELFIHPLQNSLVRFLASFSGLNTLSLLVENTSFAFRPTTFLSTHGPTLQTLVLESRIQPRESLNIDTSRPLGHGGSQQQLWQETVSDICTTCPNLVELGMAFPWEDETIRATKPSLSSLRHLKTIHIRNFPSSQSLSQLGDYAIREHALKFVQWCFSPSASTSTTTDNSNQPYQPSLETLAIGPTLHSTRWRTGTPISSTDRSVSRAIPMTIPTAVHPSLMLGLATQIAAATAAVPRLQTQTPSPPAVIKKEYTHPPEHLRTHYFCLDWAKTRFGRWDPLVSSVGEKYIEELRGGAGLDGVFEGVWLR